MLSTFQAFDENGDGHLDLKELVCGVSACSRGPLTERQKFCYKVFDIRRKKQLVAEEIVNMLSILMSVDEISPMTTDYNDLMIMAEEILNQYSDGSVENGSRFLTLDNFLIWASKTNLTFKFMRLLFQVCHVVLGLRPQNKEDELACITEWLHRDNQRVRSVGDVYYVVNMDWWRNWKRLVFGCSISLLSSVMFSFLMVIKIIS